MYPVRAFWLSLNCRLEVMISSIYSKIWPAVFNGYTSGSPNLLGKLNFEKISRCGIERLRVGLNCRNQSFEFLVHDLLWWTVESHYKGNAGMQDPRSIIQARAFSVTCMGWASRRFLVTSACLGK